MTARVDAPPALLDAFDGDDWQTYVRDDGGDERETVWAVDEPDALEWERVWLRPVALGSIPVDDRPEPFTEAVERGPDGRFRTKYVWEACHPDAPSAVAYFGVRHKP